jgi:hypothetical protein
VVVVMWMHRFLPAWYLLPLTCPFCTSSPLSLSSTRYPTWRAPPVPLSCYLALRMSNTAFDPFLTPSLRENSSPARFSHQVISSGVSIVVVFVVVPPGAEAELTVSGSRSGFGLEESGVVVDGSIFEEEEEEEDVDDVDEVGKRGRAPNEDEIERV